MRNRLLTLLAVGVVGLVLVLFVRSGDSSDAKNYRFTTATKLGSLIPVKDRKPPKTFTGELLSGGKATISGTPGAVRVVNFWAAWCGPCTVETPQFDLLYRQIRARGVSFVGIDTKDDRSDAKAFVSNNDISYPIVYDQPGQALLTLGNFPSKLPFTVLVDKTGRVAAVYVARLSDKDLQGPIDSLLAEK